MLSSGAGLLHVLCVCVAIWAKTVKANSVPVGHILAERQTSYAGYMFAYFTGDGSSTGERIYLAVSKSNDPLQWQTVKGGSSILTSNVGTGGVRDPTIIRSQDGNKFWIIATDLKIYGNRDWDKAQRQGSRSIVIWESTDLVNWGSPRLVQVSPDTAGNTWAPEAIWDSSISAYRVFWASKVYAENDPRHTASTYQKILCTTTTDFKNFTTPQIYIDKGYAVIDTTIVQDESTFYRFSKDERDGQKFVFQETSNNFLTGWSTVATNIGKGTILRGEGPTVVRSTTNPGRWYLFLDEYDGKGYVPFQTDSISNGSFSIASGYALPTSPRHGSIIPITDSEMARLKAM